MFIRVDRNEKNPLWSAYEKGDLEKFQQLIEKGTNINCILHSHSLIYTIVLNSKDKPKTSKKFFDLLLNANVHLGDIGWYSNVMEHAATKTSDIYYFKKLLEKGVDVDYHIERTEEGVGFRPPPLVIKLICNRDWDKLELLLKYNPNLNVFNEFGEIALDYLIKNIDIENEHLVELLIKGGADPKITSINRNTSPLHCAAKHLESQKIFDVLLSSGVNIDVLTKENMTPLFFAVYSKLEKGASYLISKGADVNKQDIQGRTPAFIAAQVCSPKMLNLLSKHNADFSIKNNDGENVFHYICSSHYINNIADEDVRAEFIQFMADNIDLLSVKDSENKTPLDILSYAHEKDANFLSKLIDESQRLL